MTHTLQLRSPARAPLYGLTASLMALTAWAYFTTFDVAIRGRGIVRPNGDVVKVVGETPGRISRAPMNMGITEGVAVRQGETLIEIDDRHLRLKETSLESQIRYSELRVKALDERIERTIALDVATLQVDLEDLHAAVKRAESAVTEARERLHRATRLFEAGLTSRQSLEEAENSAARAEADMLRHTGRPIELKRTQAEARRRDLQDERTPLLSAISAATKELEQCRLELARLRIPSPVSGTVASLTPMHSGEFVPAGTTIATIIPSAESLIVESWISSADRSLVASGQRVRLRVESAAAAGANAFDGIVDTVSPDVRVSENGGAAYRVTVKPQNPVVQLAPGMTFELRFVARQERLLWLLFQKVRTEFKDRL